ncbi:MAG: ribonuclease [Colwellia sp. Phe_37]|jgi:regulator of ribonuclease activity A|nr:MAG: ribonuclease [Colwellia sp. Phe_37]|tara:strand:- start:34526 stop:35008 length:483 start_codon:yes stop_codon:yes gene_type:complete
MLDLLPDLFDMHADKLSLAQPIFNDYGGKKLFHGEIVTVSCYNDNSKVKELVATDGRNKVMVVDGKASLTNALLGDMLAEQAVENGWQAIIINGCIRDAGTIATLPLAVKALGCCPIKTEKLGKGEINSTISFADLTFNPGQYIYGDSNGLAISKALLSF